MFIDCLSCIFVILLNKFNSIQFNSIHGSSVFYKIMKFERMHLLKQTVRMSKPSLVMDYSNKFILYHI